jgi:hypothetical protein
MYEILALLDYLGYVTRSVHNSTPSLGVSSCGPWMLCRNLDVEEDDDEEDEQRQYEIDDVIV